MSESFIIKCPHCDSYIEIEQINCGIFRHAIYKNMSPVNPHASREELQRIKDQIYGCGGPFKLVNKIPQICDYI